MHKIFVHETLQRRGRLHHHMEGTTFVGQDSIPSSSLYKVAWFGAEGDTKKVEGEVYAMDREQLEMIDGVQGSLYKRKLQTTTQGHEAWVYMFVGNN